MLAIEYDDFSPESARHAGVIFWKYRQAGGPREHLLPDFLVAAHAQIQCGRLAAIDRGYFRRYFPQLRILRPPRWRAVLRIWKIGDRIISKFQIRISKSLQISRIVFKIEIR